MCISKKIIINTRKCKNEEKKRILLKYSKNIDFQTILKKSENPIFNKLIFLNSLRINIK